jgi:hypothetical protein
MVSNKPFELGIPDYPIFFWTLASRPLSSTPPFLFTLLAVSKYVS